MILVVLLIFFRFFFWLKSLQKKRNGLGQETVTKVGVGGQRQPKKTKAENPTSTTGHAKVKQINYGCLHVVFFFLSSL